MKKISIVILFAGLIISGFTAFNFIVQKKIMSMSNVVAQNKSHLLMWPPVIGGLLILMGGGIYLDERMRDNTKNLVRSK